MTRVYNFSAGPSALPLAVLEQARDELVEWQQTGVSVMEMTHRGKDFLSIAERAEANLRTLLNIPDHYRVLFLQGGATAQFSAIPQNLLGAKKQLAYIDTGIWSQKAIEEAQNFAEVTLAASSKANSYTALPDMAGLELPNDAAYLHYTANETIGGLEFQSIPESRGLPLVGDLSSTILSRVIDVERFGLIYAGAQKNMGPAGITVVIVREDLVQTALPGTASVLNYRKQIDQGSMLNTPPTYAWYLLGLVLAWLLRHGGVAAIEQQNLRKANRLYDYIDASGFYANPIQPTDRSRMNVPFTLKDAALEKAFISDAKTAGLVNLEGHRSVGGCRASIYNAMPEAGVDALIAFMRHFATQHG